MKDFTDIFLYVDKYLSSTQKSNFNSNGYCVVPEKTIMKLNWQTEYQCIIDWTQAIISL